MKIQTIERGGVQMQVSFEPATPLELIVFHTIFVLDENQCPVGPNLMPMLDGVLILLNSAPGTLSAERFLSNIGEEIDCVPFTRH